MLNSWNCEDVNSCLVSRLNEAQCNDIAIQYNTVSEQSLGMTTLMLASSCISQQQSLECLFDLLNHRCVMITKGVDGGHIPYLFDQMP